MIRIKIYGCAKNKVLKQCLSTAAVYFLGILLPRKLNIQIDIRVVYGLLENEFAYGECYDYTNIEGSSAYKIQIEGLMKPLDILSTLAHEMVHVKQFDKKELKFLLKCNKWHGVKFDSETKYADYPWEHEAEKLEIELRNSFKLKYPQFNKFLKIKAGIKVIL